MQEGFCGGVDFGKRSKQGWISRRISGFGAEQFRVYRGPGGAEPRMVLDESTGYVPWALRSPHFGAN